MTLVQLPVDNEKERIRQQLRCKFNEDLDEVWATYWRGSDPQVDLELRAHIFWETQKQRLLEGYHER